MTFQQTIKLMMELNPFQFKSREDCYDRLFCFERNGFEWVNGRLISTEGWPDEEKQVEIKAAWAQRERDFWSGIGLSEEQITEQIKVLEEEVKGRWPKRFFTMITEKSKIYNIPEDIDHTWLNGAFAALESIAKLDSTFTDTCVNIDNKLNQSRALEIQAKLDERFGDG
jgi:hypothetical protein